MGMPTKTLHAEKIHTHSRLTDHFNYNNMAVHLFSCTIRPYRLTTANGSQNEYAHTNNMVLFLMVTGFSLAIELTFELFRQILAKQEIAAEKNKAELALYKAQINPHFMFNTLNMLYALVLSGSDKTEPAFVKFSNILRYMYAQTHSENIPIGQEIEYIRQYTDLQKLRLNHHTRVTLTAQTDNETTPVPSMIFITFVENAFKYGTSADTDCNIQINICLKNGLLSFDTVNTIIRHVDSEHEGIGIANCRKRLELLYPGRYELENGPTGNVYITKLKIQL